MSLLMRQVTRHIHLLGALVLVAGLGAGAAPARGGETQSVYLALMLKEASAPEIWGYVTDDGAPAGDVEVRLSRYGPSPAYPLLSVLTLADGRYHFSDVPALQPGQSYRIETPINFTDPSRMAHIGSGFITTLTAGTSLHAFDFDVATVPNVSPAPGAEADFPITFTWSRRAASPTDDYTLEVSTTSGPSQIWWYGNLGWVSEHTRYSLPSGAAADTWYRWKIRAFLPGGGQAQAFGASTICFGSCPTDPPSTAGHEPSHVADRHSRFELVSWFP